MIERALAPAHAAEIEAQHREAPVQQGVADVVEDLVVHRDAELRMPLHEYGDGGILLLRRVIPAFDPPSRAGKDDFGHAQPRRDSERLLNSAGPLTLTTASGERPAAL